MKGLRSDGLGAILLQGVRVVDLTLLLPGPFASRMLADMGADVIKVEPIKGDMTRQSPISFDAVNWGKKSIALNLKDDRGKEALYRLVARADVVMEGFRPGVVKRLGVDYETLSARNPSLVYCSISGYGQDGPLKDRPGHDINYLGLAGALSLMGEPLGPPRPTYGLPIADLTSAMYAAVSILAALIFRLKKGQGCYLDVSMTDTVAAWMGVRIAEYFAKGRPDKAFLLAKGAYGVFETQDGAFLTLGAIEDEFFKRLAKALELSALASDDRFQTFPGRMLHQAELEGILKEAIKARTLSEWAERFEAHDVPWGPVNTIEGALCDPQLVARGVFEDKEHTGFGKANLAKFPVKVNGGSVGLTGKAPDLGGNTAELLLEVGFSEPEIETLKREGVCL